MLLPENRRQSQKKTKRLIRVALIVIAAGAVVALISFARDAAIRHAARQLHNPVAPTAAALASAKDNYDRNCADCHGATGDGKGSKAASLWSAPTNFQSDPEMNGELDGELYWVITKGSWPMPAFAQRLDDLSRWQLVTYIRTFSHH